MLALPGLLGWQMIQRRWELHSWCWHHLAEPVLLLSAHQMEAGQKIRPDPRSTYHALVLILQESELADKIHYRRDRTCNCWYVRAGLGTCSV